MKNKLSKNSSSTHKKYVKCSHCENFLSVKTYKRHLSTRHNVVEDSVPMSQELFTLEQLNDFRRKSRIKSLKKNIKSKPTRKSTNVVFGELKDYTDVKKKHAEDRSKNSKTYYIIWDDIFFEKDKVRFSHNRIEQMLHSIEVKGVFEELNLIKGEYFIRIYGKKLYKLTFLRNKLVLDLSPDWKKIIETIEVAIEYFHFKNSKRNGFGPKIRSNLAVALYKEDFDKNTYLKYLASIHTSEFRLILIIEMYNNKREESFIFRVIKNNQIFLIWENVRKSRATHVFSSTIESHELILTTLESFICSSMSLKRSRLYFDDQESLLVKNDLGYLSSVKHTDLFLYELAIQQILCEPMAFK